MLRKVVKVELQLEFDAKGECIEAVKVNGKRVEGSRNKSGEDCWEIVAPSDDNDEHQVLITEHWTG